MTLTSRNDESSERRLLTVTDAAKFLGCSRANVYGLIEAGDLPFITIGKSRGYRIDRHDLEAFLQRRKTVKADERPVVPASHPRLKHIKL